MVSKQADKKQAKKPVEPPKQEARTQDPAIGVQPVVPVRAARITPQVALEALLVSWLCLRDFALWAFVQGVDSEAPLADVDLSQIGVSVEQMNAMRGAVMHFAKQIAGKNDPAAVLRDAIAKVRSGHAPVFSLTVLSLPSAF
jgi:hypothetical protein